MCGFPPILKASLLRGPKTTPSTWPARAISTATLSISIQSFPAAALRTPQGNSCSGHPVSTTGIVPDGIASVFDGSQRVAAIFTFATRMPRSRSHIGPTTTGQDTFSMSGLARLFATSSGPMPAGSPSTHAILGFMSLSGIETTSTRPKHFTAKFAKTAKRSRVW